MCSPKRLKLILMYIINSCKQKLGLTLKRHRVILDYLSPNFVQSPSLDLQKTHFRSIFRSFWKAICPLLPWHLWMLSIAVFIDIGWRALWILMCSSTPLHLAPRNSLTFAHCEAALFMYAWDFHFKSQSIHCQCQEPSSSLAQGVKRTSRNKDKVTMVTGGRITFCQIERDKESLLTLFLRCHDTLPPHPVSSPQTSVGAPGWRCPPRVWEHCNILPPPGSATCTWRKKGLLYYFFICLLIVAEVSKLQ